MFVRSADDIWLAFVLVTLGVIATAFFEPARTAMLPDVVPREHLITANALSAATWAVMLAVGASVGGAVTVLVGRDAAFVCNGLSFLASALALRGLRVTETHHELHAAGAQVRVRDGWHYLRAHPSTMALLSIKGVWAVAGGMMLLLTVFGQRVFAASPTDTAARGIGVLFAARGVGAIGGALLARGVQQFDAARLRALVPWAYGLAALGYLGLASRAHAGDRRPRRRLGARVRHAALGAEHGAAAAGGGREGARPHLRARARAAHVRVGRGHPAHGHRAGPAPHPAAHARDRPRRVLPAARGGLGHRADERRA